MPHPCDYPLPSAFCLHCFWRDNHTDGTCTGKTPSPASPRQAPATSSGAAGVRGEDDAQLVRRMLDRAIGCLALEFEVCPGPCPYLPRKGTGDACTACWRGWLEVEARKTEGEK